MMTIEEMRKKRERAELVEQALRLQCIYRAERLRTELAVQDDRAGHKSPHAPLQCPDGVRLVHVEAEVEQLVENFLVLDLLVEGKRPVLAAWTS